MFLAALLTDPNLSPAFRRVFAEPREDLLTRAADKAAPRRFSGEPLTGFGSLDADLAALDRRDETGDREAHQRDELADRIARGE